MNHITSTIEYIPVEKLHPHPDNPRKNLGDLTELAESVKANGILQNLTVVPMDGATDEYTVLIGHRRLAAAILAGVTTVPCVVTDMTPAEQVKTMLIENMQRSDLTVFEQAQGFQMMLDLGSSVEEIAEKSGFSTTTVRRRVKMMELDQKKLKEVADDGDRQLKLEDFDRLAQIEDIKTRNKVLEDIGTNDFARSVTGAINDQEAKKRKPALKKWLKAAKAVELKNYSDTYSGKYQSISSYIYLHDWDESKAPAEKDYPDGLYYYLDNNSVRFFRKAPKTEKPKKSKAELEKERKIKEAWKIIDDAASIAYDLRKAFIEKLAVTGKNKDAIMMGALKAALAHAVDYNSPDTKTLCPLLGLDDKGWDKERLAKAMKGLAELKEADLAKLVYALWGDNDKEHFAEKYGRSSYPVHARNYKLEAIYEWLACLGYDMSTEELAMLSGDHEVFKENG